MLVVLELLLPLLTGSISAVLFVGGVCASSLCVLYQRFDV